MKRFFAFLVVVLALGIGSMFATPAGQLVADQVQGHNMETLTATGTTEAVYLRTHGARAIGNISVVATIKASGVVDILDAADYAGTIQVTNNGTDWVVFKTFDGNDGIYSFNPGAVYGIRVAVTNVDSIVSLASQLTIVKD